MNIMVPLSERPPADLINQQMLTVRLSLEAAQKDSAVRAELVENPGAFLAAAGYPLTPEEIPDFNRFFHEEPGVSRILGMLQSGEDMANLQGIGCTICKVAAYSIGVAIVAVGAAALSTLTAGSAVVIALASFAGVAAATSLAFIVGLTTAVGGGAGVVASHICSWTGACR